MKLNTKRPETFYALKQIDYFIFLNESLFITESEKEFLNKIWVGQRTRWKINRFNYIKIKNLYSLVAVRSKIHQEVMSMKMNFSTYETRKKWRSALLNNSCWLTEWKANGKVGKNLWVGNSLWEKTNRLTRVSKDSECLYWFFKC